MLKGHVVTAVATYLQQSSVQDFVLVPLSCFVVVAQKNTRYSERSAGTKVKFTNIMTVIAMQAPMPIDAMIFIGKKAMKRKESKSTNPDKRMVAPEVAIVVLMAVSMALFQLSSSGSYVAGSSSRNRMRRKIA